MLTPNPLEQMLGAARQLQTAEACAGLKLLAKTLWAFYYALKMEGFETEQAFFLTNQYMTTQLVAAHNTMRMQRHADGEQVDA